MKTEKKANNNDKVLEELMSKKQSALLKLYAAMAKGRFEMISNLSDELNEINEQIIKLKK